jgi:excisionase family DNA binding protein
MIRRPNETKSSKRKSRRMSPHVPDQPSSGTDSNSGDSSPQPERVHGLEKMVSSTEIMDVLGCNRTTLWRWVKFEGLPAYQMGRKGDFRFRPSEVAAWLETRRTRPQDK